MMRATIETSLSIVVIGRNEGQRLARCLASVRSIRGIEGPMEIIYVDSGSTDDSPRLAREAGAQVVVLDAERCTAALGRNAGWKLAASAFVLFLDGDTVVDSEFPRRALDALATNLEVAAVWGHRREMHPERSIYNRILDLDWIVRPGITDYCGGDVLMRRQVLEEAGGYDATLIAGEEPELCRRLRSRGHRILHIDAPMTGHDLAMTGFSQYWKRAVRAGYAYAEVSRRFHDSADPLWQPESRRNFVRCAFWVLSAVMALAAGAWLRSAVPIAAWLGLLSIYSLRSAWRARWKSPNVLTLLLYGVHSHLQQIPICVGQLMFALHNRHGTSRKLIEYK